MVSPQLLSFIRKVSDRGGAVNEPEIKLEGNNKTTCWSSEKLWSYFFFFCGGVNFEDFKGCLHRGRKKPNIVIYIVLGS